MNKNAIKTWATKIVNQGKSNSQYDNKRPIDWDIDDFKSYVKDYLDNNGRPSTNLKMFNLPSESLFKYYANHGTGLNNDQYWNKYKNFGGAMYDLFTYLKKTIFTGVKSESKINEYGKKPKAGVQVNYAKEIAQRTGTREDAVNRWLKMMEIAPLTILQGIGSGRINRNDFVDALLSDEATKEFLEKYNSDGKWSSVWKATPKNESNIQKVKKMISQLLHETNNLNEVSNDLNELSDRFFETYYESLNILEMLVRQLDKNHGKETQNKTKLSRIDNILRQMTDNGNILSDYIDQILYKK